MKYKIECLVHIVVEDVNVDNAFDKAKDKLRAVEGVTYVDGRFASSVKGEQKNETL